MAKKLKKTQKNQMSPRTRALLGNGFRSIISNQAAIDGAKESPWWLAVLFFLFSIIIPLIPNYVSMNNAYGSKFISSATYNADRGLARATANLKNNGYKFEVEKGLMHFYKDNVEIDFASNPEYIQKGYINPYNDVFGSDPELTYHDQYNFRLYITDKTGKELSTLVNTWDKEKYKANTTSLIDPTEITTAPYTPSFLLLTPKTMACAIYKANTSSRAGTTNGGLDWKHSKGDLLTYLTDGIEIQYVDTDLGVQADIFARWKKVFNQTYLTQKDKTKWSTVLIYLGIYAGLEIFLGLMVFLLTRGKNNIFNYLNFWVCQKIGYWLSPTPAILALILGFVMAGNVIGQMAFIMLIALRVMWASMRQLRPVQ